MKDYKVKVGITHGDINGIGYEVVIKTLMDNRIIEMCTPIVYGSPKVAAYHRKALNVNNFSFNAINNAGEANAKRANIINCIDENIRVELGQSTTAAGESSFMALEKAITDLKEGKIDVLVTAPINKDNIQSKDFSFPGHTEYLASRFDSDNQLMLLVSDDFRVGVATGHVPISEVPKLITKETIIKKVNILHESLIYDFGIRKPRVAVLALNPHAGDNGLLGKEEQDIIIPAIQALKDSGILAFGPFPADGYFGSDQFKKFDGVIAMYHDQGLAPFKALSFDTGVNYTAGLEVVRTSPDHGTAYEIAGQDKASEVSFRQSLYLACDIFKNRKIEKELRKNPLKSHKIDDKTQNQK